VQRNTLHHEQQSKVDPPAPPVEEPEAAIHGADGGPLTELCSILRKKVMTLRRAEGHRRRRKERARKRIAFLANPFGFTKQMRGQKNSNQLTCSKAEDNRQLRDTISDETREQDPWHQLWNLTEGAT